MNLSDELKAFLETLSRFREKELEPQVLEWEENFTPIPQSVLASAQQIGLFNFWLAPSPGEKALLEGRLAQALVIKELARSSPDLAWLVALQILASVIWLHLPESARESLRKEICFSENSPVLFSLGIWEPGVRSLNEIQSQLDSAFRLKIYKHLVPIFEQASRVIFLVKDQEGKLRFVVLDKSQLGSLNSKPQGVLGIRLCPRYEVQADAQISQQELVEGAFDSLFPELQKIHSLLNSALLLGIGEACYQRAFDYAQERYQGGKIIAQHQVIFDLLEKMKARKETLSQALYYACQNPDLELNVWLNLRQQIAQECIDLALDGVQTLGGYGYMLDYGQEKRLRDITTLAHLEFAFGWEKVVS